MIFVLLCGLFYWRENGRCVVSDSDSESGIWTEVSEAFDTRKIEAQPGSPDLHTKSSFCLRLGAEWTIARSRVRTPVDFACQTKLFVDAKDSRDSVCDHVVLRKQFGGRRENRDSEIAESIESAVATKFLADQNRAERVRLIESDTRSLARVWKLHAETKSQRRTTTRFVSQFELGCQCEIARVVSRVGSGQKIERNCGRAARIDTHVILGHAFDLKLDIRSHSETDADNADARQIPSNARNRKPRTLHEIDARLDADRARRDDVDVFGYQWPLLSAGNAREGRQQQEDERDANHCAGF